MIISLCLSSHLSLYLSLLIFPFFFLFHSNTLLFYLLLLIYLSLTVCSSVFLSYSFFPLCFFLSYSFSYTLSLLPSLPHTFTHSYLHSLLPSLTLTFTHSYFHSLSPSLTLTSIFFLTVVLQVRSVGLYP